MVFEVQLQHHVAPLAGERDDLVEGARIGEQPSAGASSSETIVAQGSRVVRVESRILVIGWHVIGAIRGR